MAVLILKTASTRTRVISANFLICYDRSLSLLLSIGHQIVTMCLQTRLVRFGLHCPSRLFPDRDESSEQEGEHILIQRVQHLGEEIVTLKLVNHLRVFLLVNGVLHTLLKVINIPEMGLPMLVYLEEYDILTQSLSHFPSLGVIGLLQVHGQIDHLPSI